MTWRLVGDVLRRDAGGGAQPGLNAVQSLTRTYYDAAGALAIDAAAVCRITVSLTTRADHATSRTTRDLGAIFTTDVHLRNH